jgi:hypothetical protein
MPRSGRSRFVGPSDEARNESIFEKNSVEDAETVDILDSELLTALGYTPSVDQFLNDYRVIRVPLLAADVANEAAVDVTVHSVFRNAGDDGYTVTVGAAASGLVADTKFVRVRVIPA